MSFFGLFRRKTPPLPGPRGIAQTSRYADARQKLDGQVLAEQYAIRDSIRKAAATQMQQASPAVEEPPPRGILSPEEESEEINRLLRQERQRP